MTKPRTPVPPIKPFAKEVGQTMAALWKRLPMSARLKLVSIAEQHAVNRGYLPQVEASRNHKRKVRERLWPRQPIWPLEQRLRRIWVFLGEEIQWGLTEAASELLGEHPAKTWFQVVAGRRLTKKIGVESITKNTNTRLLRGSI